MSDCATMTASVSRNRAPSVPVQGTTMDAVIDAMQGGDDERIEAFYRKADAQREARKTASCADFGKASADRAQAAELNRLPLGGYLHG